MHFVGRPAKAAHEEGRRKGLLVTSGDEAKGKVSTAIVVGLVMLVLGLTIGVVAERLVGQGSALA